jgi:hypothetical protein
MNPPIFFGGFFVYNELMKDKGSWIIKLPSKSKILVKIGDKIEENQKLAIFSSHAVESFDYSAIMLKLSDEAREELNLTFKDKGVKEGEVFYKEGFLKNKLCFPTSGTCLGFDEFKNLKIEKSETEKKEIFSPVGGKISKIEDGKMVIEFEAKEYEGVGLNELKAWGKGEIKIIDDVKLLDYEMDKNVLFTQNFDLSFLLKAQVVGIKAVVVLSENINEIEMEIPLLRLDKKVWDDFMKENWGKEKKMLVNAKTSKLLLVLE